MLTSADGTKAYMRAMQYILTQEAQRAAAASAPNMIPNPMVGAAPGAAPNVNPNPMVGAAPGLVATAQPPPVDPFAQQQVLPTSPVVDAYVPPPNLGALPSTQYPVTQYSVPTDTPVTNADEFLEGLGDKLRNGGGYA